MTCPDCREYERCERHAAMMEAIADGAYFAKPLDGALLRRVAAHCDGYGVVGFCPDWSAIRDSSTSAIEAMFAQLPPLS